MAEIISAFGGRAVGFLGSTVPHLNLTVDGPVTCSPEGVGENLHGSYRSTQQPGLSSRI
jgi:hypothetical protein